MAKVSGDLFDDDEMDRQANALFFLGVFFVAWAALCVAICWGVASLAFWIIGRL